ncbi:uncharacterized protein LOC123514896 [Portunus trituberculatus]|uniref:uncharacterized protein LOC123514896 n=1 Tax=Portunus trituberculatus TaxID=210409 RepID=UPI001E1CB648|nr:uncharacterized protein LOC123514896 [Portunus trituberculatus]
MKLDETIQSVNACDEDIEISENFTYLGSVLCNDGGTSQEVVRQIGLTHSIMDSLNISIWRCRYLCRRTKIQIFKSLVIPVSLYGYEQDYRCLRRIMRYHWYDFVSNQRLLHETDSRPITSIVNQCQLQLYGHVAHYLEADPAYQVVSKRDNPAWKRPMGRPQNSWLWIPQGEGTLHIGDFNVHHELWLSSPFTDHPVELAFNSAICLYDLEQLFS